MRKPVQAKYQKRWKNRVSMGRRDADRTKVGKPVSWPSRKAAIVYIVPVP